MFTTGSGHGQPIAAVIFDGHDARIGGAVGAFGQMPLERFDVGPALMPERLGPHAASA